MAVMNAPFFYVPRRRSFCSSGWSSPSSLRRWSLAMDRPSPPELKPRLRVFSALTLPLVGLARHLRRVRLDHVALARLLLDDVRPLRALGRLCRRRRPRRHLAASRAARRLAFARAPLALVRDRPLAVRVPHLLGLHRLLPVHAHLDREQAGRGALLHRAHPPGRSLDQLVPRLRPLRRAVRRAALVLRQTASRDHHRDGRVAPRLPLRRYPLARRRRSRRHARVAVGRRAAVLLIGGLLVAFAVWRQRGRLLSAYYDPDFVEGTHYESR